MGCCDYLTKLKKIIRATQKELFGSELFFVATVARDLNNSGRPG